jgi:hypothetical protein
MIRVFLFFLSISISVSADTIKIQINGTIIEGSPLVVELRAGSDILDVMAVAGGMTASSSSRVMLTRAEQRYVIDTVELLCIPDREFLIQSGDIISIAEHMIGTGYWERYNALLFERVIRRHHGLPITDIWRKKAFTLYEKTRKKVV